jgi:uncharacterized protein HemY
LLAVFASPPQSKEAPRVSRAIALARMREWRSAQAVLEQVLATDPSDRTAKRTLAAVLVDSGKWNDASKVLGEILDSRLESPEDVLTLAVAHHQGGDAGRAKELYEQFLKMVPPTHAHAAEVRVIHGRL